MSQPVCETQTTTGCLCPLHAHAPAMREALENVTATLESIMVHFQDRMPHADKIGRRKVLDAARALLRQIEHTS